MHAAEIPHPESIISLEGVFDGVAALRVEEALLRAGPGQMPSGRTARSRGPVSTPK